MWPGMPKLPKITSLLCLCIILRKNWVMKLIFCMQISMKASYKMIIWFWWGWSSIPKVPKIASLQYLYKYLKKEVEDEVDILLVDKHQSFLKFYFNNLGIEISYKVDIVMISGNDQAFSNYLISLQYLYNISKKKLWMQVIFGMQVNVKVSTSWYYPFYGNGQTCSEYPK